MHDHLFRVSLLLGLCVLTVNSFVKFKVRDEDNYIMMSIISTKNAEYPFYCPTEPACVCNEVYRGYVLHCEKEVHAQLTNNYDEDVFVYITCNKTIQPHQLNYDYNHILRLERFAETGLSLTDCPQPPDKYRSLLAPKSLSHQNGGQPSIFKLNIDCGDRKEFSFTKDHFEGLNELKYLEISCRLLMDLPEDFFRGNLPNLLSLNISNTLMEVIPEGLFTDLFNLTTLILMSNRLVEIRSEDFLGLNSLTSLYIQEEFLMHMWDDVFNNLSTLETFSLHQSKMTSLPSSFGNLTNLSSMTMVGNSIESIEKHHCEFLNNLEHFNLKYNLVRYVDPVCFSKFERLRSLDISGNRLSELPNKVFSMDEITKFFFEGNSENLVIINRFIKSDGLMEIHMENSSIESFAPDFLHSIPNLEFINLNENKLKFLHEDFFAHSPNLQKLLMGKNRLTAIPDTLFRQVPYVKLLILNSNGINNLPVGVFSNMSYVQMMRLEENAIEIIPNNVFSNLERLQRLFLSNNKIKVFENDSLTGLRSLTLFDLSDNMLDNSVWNAFRPIWRSEMLSTLKLQGNMISAIPPLEFPNLKLLNLENNSLDHVDEDTFTNLKILQALILSRNNLKSLPNSTFTRSREMITLDVSFNQLDDFPSQFLPPDNRLLKISLSGNEIEKFDLCSIRKAKRVETIDLSQNRLNYIGDLSRCGFELPSVTFLNLSHNHLSFNYSSRIFDDVRMTWGSVSPLLYFPNVEEIDLTNNSISTIFMDWRNILLRLRKIDLRYNNLDYLTHQDLLFSSTAVYNNGTEEPYGCSHSLVLDLRHNLIKTVELPPKMLMRSNLKRKLYGHTTVLLGHNPFHCGCGINNLFRVLEGDMVLVSELWRTEGKDWILPARIDADNLTCWNPETIRGKKLLEPETWLHHIVPTFGFCPFAEK